MGFWGFGVFLLDLYEDFDTPSAVAYFKSMEDQQDESNARLLIESARDWTGEMKEDQIAKVLFAALLIGGKTLSKFDRPFKNWSKAPKL